MVGKALYGSPPNSSNPQIINLSDNQFFVNSRISAFDIITEQHVPMRGRQFAVAATDGTELKIFDQPGSKPYEPKFTTSSALVFAACKNSNNKK